VQIISLSLFDNVFLHYSRGLSLSHRPVSAAGIAFEHENSIALDEVSVRQSAFCTDNVLLEVGLDLPGNGLLTELSLKYSALPLDLACRSHLLKKVLYEMLRIAV